MKKNIENWRNRESQFFGVGNFGFFFKKYIFCFIPIKIRQNFLYSKDGSKSWWQYCMLIIQKISIFFFISYICKFFKTSLWNLNSFYIFRLFPSSMNEGKWKKVMGNKSGITIYSWTLWDTYDHSGKINLLMIVMIVLYFLSIDYPY